MKKVLVVIDMQRDFVTGALGTAEARAVVPRVAAKIAAAVSSGTPVVYTRDTHGADYLSTSEGKKLPVPHCVKGSPGWEILPELYVPGGKVFDKPAFGSVELAGWLQREGVAEVELAGVCTDVCVISNALLVKAFLPEARVTVDASCCAGATPAGHETALAAMRSCQIEIM